LDSQFTKFDGQLKEWKQFNRKFIDSLEYPNPPGEILTAQGLSEDQRMLRLESHTSFLKFHGIEKYFGTSGPGDSSNKKLSQDSLKQIERLEEEEVKGLGGRDEWYKSLFGLEDYGVQSEPSKNEKQRLESHLTPIIVKYQPDDALKDIPGDAILSQPNVFMSYLLQSSKSDTSQLASS